MAASNKTENEVSHFLRRLVLSMNDGVGKHNAQAQVSGVKRSMMDLLISRTVDRKLQDIVSDQSVLTHG